MPLTTYAWIIDKDRLNTDKTIRSRKGITGPRGANAALVARLRAGDGRKFRMKDDDGEVYYEGRILVVVDGDEAAGEVEDFGPLDDFGTPDAGCTSIEYRVGRAWEVL